MSDSIATRDPFRNRWTAGSFCLLVGAALSLGVAYYLYQLLTIETTMELRWLRHNQILTIIFALSLFVTFLATVQLIGRPKLMAFAISLFAFNAGTAWILNHEYIVVAAPLAIIGTVMIVVRSESTKLYKGGVLAAVLISAAPVVLPHACASMLEYAARPTVSQVKSDLRNIATAIEAYTVDHGVFPPWTVERDRKADWQSDVTMPTFQAIGPRRENPLTTPEPFLFTMPEDPCRYLKEERTFAYWSLDGAGYVLIGAGPNCVFDTDPERLTAIRDAEGFRAIETQFIDAIYDPTNGTRSVGDIWRIGGQ